MRDQPGGSSTGVQTSDVRAEHQRLSRIDGVTVSTPPMPTSGAPLMFSVTDPDGNYIWITETPRAS